MSKMEYSGANKKPKRRKNETKRKKKKIQTIINVLIFSTICWSEMVSGSQLGTSKLFYFMKRVIFIHIHNKYKEGSTNASERVYDKLLKGNEVESFCKLLAAIHLIMKAILCRKWIECSENWRFHSIFSIVVRAMLGD